MDKNTLEKLYLNDKQSISFISKDNNISTDRIKKLLHKYEIPIRTKSEQAYIQHNPSGASFKIREINNLKDSYLLGLGLGLYWGEGNKADPYSVRLGNTDPELIKVFLLFLREICKVNENKIKYGLQVFNDMDPIEAQNFWINKLEIKKESFHQKIVISPPQGKGTYKNKSKYGVLQIYVSDKRLKEWITGKIAEIYTVI